MVKAPMWDLSPFITRIHLSFFISSFPLVYAVDLTGLVGGSYGFTGLRHPALIVQPAVQAAAATDPLTALRLRFGGPWAGWPSRP
jgi:hypothetical protein